MTASSETSTINCTYYGSTSLPTLALTYLAPTPAPSKIFLNSFLLIIIIIHLFSVFSFFFFLLK